MNKKESIYALENYIPQYKEENLYKEKIIDFINDNNDFYTKKNTSGHITCSAWIINKDNNKVLLTHHVKLDKWIQLGGHVEEDKSMLDAAYREALEESGLPVITPLQNEIFDIDVHFIPERKDESGHYHYDIRYIFQADSEISLVITDESNDLKWFSFAEFREEITDRSMVRMLEKTISKINKVVS